VNEVASGETADLCFDQPGVRRLEVDGAAWSGGFVIVDPEEEP
jgi:hypothetical protein